MTMWHTHIRDGLQPPTPHDPALDKWKRINGFMHGWKRMDGWMYAWMHGPHQIYVTIETRPL